MGWNRIGDTPPPANRPVLVRTIDGDEPTVAFLAPDGVWYEGGALVQSNSTVLAAVPMEWCEPSGEDSL